MRRYSIDVYVKVKDSETAVTCLSLTNCGKFSQEANETGHGPSIFTVR